MVMNSSSQVVTSEPDKTEKMPKDSSVYCIRDFYFMHLERLSSFDCRKYQNQNNVHVPSQWFITGTLTNEAHLSNGETSMYSIYGLYS